MPNPPPPPASRLLVDGLRMRSRTMDAPRDPKYRICSTHEISARIDYDACCGPGRERRPAGQVTVASEADDEVSPRSLAARLAAGPTPMLLDVREPHEWSIARLPDARLVPLDTLPDVVHTLDPNAEVIVYCHHGIRSAAAVAWLRDRGFRRARNLTGGIDRWSREVDPSTRRY